MATSPSSPPPAEWNLLLSACQKNDSALVLKLLNEQKVDPSHSNVVGQSALHVASLWGHDECVRILIDAGANVNAQNSITGGSPLHCTVTTFKSTPEKRLQVIKLLIEEGGADMSLADNYGRTAYDMCEEEDADLKEILAPQKPPIFDSLEKADVAAIKSLLEQDSSLIQARYVSKTPLLTVVDNLLDAEQDSESQLEILSLLLSHGADPNTVLPSSPDLLQDDMDPPLHQLCVGIKNALEDKNEEHGQNLMKAACLLKNDATKIPSETLRLLHDAARRGRIRLIDFLVQDLGIDVNVKGRQGMTALIFAARSGKTNIVLHLLTQYKADATLKDDLGRTALDAAISNQREDIVNLLQEHSTT